MQDQQSSMGCDKNLYLGGSSGNRGFRGPGCSDLPFFEPDIL